jgi:hypothetical protein
VLAEESYLIFINCPMKYGNLCNRAEATAVVRGIAYIINPTTMRVESVERK